MLSPPTDSLLFICNGRAMFLSFLFIAAHMLGYMGLNRHKKTLCLDYFATFYCVLENQKVEEEKRVEGGRNQDL